jgi:hypothetical protein
MCQFEWHAAPYGQATHAKPGGHDALTFWQDPKTRAQEVPCRRFAPLHKSSALTPRLLRSVSYRSQGAQDA